MAGVFILIVLILGTGVELVTAQIPSVCAKNANLTSGVCCPDNCGGSIRGECVRVSTMCKINYVFPSNQQHPPNDERFNWPSRIFSQVCRCNGNYGGYDCSECKFGYEGQDCNTKQTERVRTSITNADFNWANYHNQLSRAKDSMQSRYKAYTGNDIRNEMNYKSVSLYDLFTWMHHYVSFSKQKEYLMDGSAGDYAHQSVGFLTWHRIYLLWFEREMQILLDDNQFTVRYWDWTVPENRDALFKRERLGESAENGRVMGDLMTGWYIVCVTDGDPIEGSICDPTTSTPGNKNVDRCGEVGSCDAAVWPDAANVRRSLTDHEFDNFRTNANPKYNKYDTMSFSNYMEGFAYDDNADCEGAQMIPDEKERNLLCGDGNTKIRRRLHNLIHILLNGTMGAVPIAANDPVFINHHTMIDCLFEQWLTSHPNSQYPPTLLSQFAGHAGGDCMVPFIPVYNHSEVFSKRANDFGYSCDLRSFLAGSHNTGPCTGSTKNHCSSGINASPTPTPTNRADNLLASATTLVSMLLVCLVAATA